MKTFKAPRVEENQRLLPLDFVRMGGQVLNSVAALLGHVFVDPAENPTYGVVLWGLTTQSAGGLTIRVNVGAAILSGTAEATGQSLVELVSGGDTLTKLLVATGAPRTAHIWVVGALDTSDSEQREFRSVGVGGDVIQTRAVDTYQRIKPTLQATYDNEAAPAGAVWVADVALAANAAAIGAITDKRTLLWEGTGSGSSWAPSPSSFSRSALRGSAGIRGLKQFVAAVQHRVLELAGRDKWYAAPTFGENVRSASGCVTVRCSSGSAGDSQTAHMTLGAAADNRAALTILLNCPNSGDYASGTDPRASVTFLPDGRNAAGVVEVDCTSNAVIASGDAFRRRFSGAANIRRTAGEHTLLATPEGTEANGFKGDFHGLTFSATDGAMPLLKVRHAADDLVFTSCTFDGQSAPDMSTLVSIESSTEGQSIPEGADAVFGRVLFVNCRFLMTAGQTGLEISGDPRVKIVGGCITGGERCLNIDTDAAQVSIIGARLQGETIIEATSTFGLHLSGCSYHFSIALFDIPGFAAVEPLDVGDYEAGTLAHGAISGGSLESRGGVVTMGEGNVTVTRAGGVSTATFTDGDGAPANLAGGHLRAASGRSYLGESAMRWERVGTQLAKLTEDGGAIGSMVAQLGRLLLGANVVDLALLSRHTIPKAWGVIQHKSDWWAAPDDGDRATGVDGYYESRTCTGAGAALTVTGYYADPDGSPSGLLVANPPPSEQARKCAIFHVSGLGLPDARYVVQPVVDVALARPYGGADSSAVNFYPYIPPAPDPMTWLPYRAVVFNKAADSFWIALEFDAGTYWTHGTWDYSLGFTVFAPAVADMPNGGD